MTEATPAPGTPPPSPGTATTPGDTLADRVAAVVTAHPAVARLHGGVFGAVATYLPGRRLVGVRVGDPGERVELALVARLGYPLPAVVRALRAEVSALCGGVPVDITVADLDVPAEAIGGPAAPSPSPSPSPET